MARSAVRTIAKKSAVVQKYSTLSRITERFLVSLGVMLVTFYALARIQGVVTLHAAMRAFAEAKPHSEDGDGAGARNAPRPGQVDFSLWSAERIHAYEESLKIESATPLAVLEIPRLHIVAPVLDGLSDLALNGGVGRIPGTARPGQPGNIGIAGHRDGFFRGLKDIAKGDTIQLATTRKTQTYVVDNVFITNPENVNVLRPRAAPSITLVTCYPFYFIGSAPQRYIVQASLKKQGKTQRK
jgi:sortase A